MVVWIALRRNVLKMRQKLVMGGVMCGDLACERGRESGIGRGVSRSPCALMGWMFTQGGEYCTL